MFLFVFNVLFCFFVDAKRISNCWVLTFYFIVTCVAP